MERASGAGSAGRDAGRGGIIRIKWYDFLQQLTTFRVQAPSVGHQIAALNRFGVFFFGKIWDVFLRQFAVYAPF